MLMSGFSINEISLFSIKISFISPLKNNAFFTLLSDALIIASSIADDITSNPKTFFALSDK